MTSGLKGMDPDLLDSVAPPASNHHSARQDGYKDGIASYVAVDNIINPRRRSTMASSRKRAVAKYHRDRGALPLLALRCGVPSLKASNGPMAPSSILQELAHKILSLKLRSSSSRPPSPAPGGPCYSAAARHMPDIHSIQRNQEGRVGLLVGFRGISNRYSRQAEFDELSDDDHYSRAASATYEAILSKVNQPVEDAGVAAAPTSDREIARGTTLYRIARA
ncbi:uncharacterized protein LAESUDRAFT_748694 [Laetiporus sulphureus 93-53]|uniref:Uncharacterized protein n=1 Tax=Laetiporus sulphureus 93-53 TaxID=1314785 RepID=A0A165F8D5_9APHY|nr:uncharacterized protein LAESUDRAFT_748694 [Laetiporus sulphureus 93-53]KZT08583.1 hypothetical protein LAESUDRAFT_748694 [Laetiporus sulphureus 93-53]